MLVLVGCARDINQQFIGTWIDSYDMGILGQQSTDLSLYEDMSCKLKMFGQEMNGTWSVKDKTLTLKLRNRNESDDSPYNVSTFTVVRINDHELFLKKPGSNDVTEYYKK